VQGIKDPLVLALIAMASFCMGCARPSLIRPDKKKEEPVWIKPTWGMEAEGLQCRLRPARRVWQTQETPTFKVDLRNGGKRIFAFAACESLPVHRIIVDGRVRPWPSPPTKAGKNRPFAPGVEFTDLPLSLSVSLSAGRHVIQVVLSFEEVEVVSNPVTIEIARGP